MKYIRAFFHTLPFYLVFMSLLFIALPVDFKNKLFPSENSKNAVYSENRIISNNAVQLEDQKTVSEVAKMAISYSKDKADLMKESYDRLFSIVTAVAALIAFLGFKGVDSFLTARKEAEEALVKANEAQANAEKALDKVEKFINETYPQDNKDELNVVIGMIMRHMADSYKNILDKVKPGHNYHEDEIFIGILDNALYYLNSINDKKESKDLLAKAAITKGNIYKRRKSYDLAINSLEELERKYKIIDDSAIYNIACYSCLMAEELNKTQSSIEALRYMQKSLDNLKRSICINIENKTEAKNDRDFEWFRTTKNHEFVKILEQ